MGTELPTKVMLGQTLVLMQMTYLNNVREVGILVFSRTSCIICDASGKRKKNGNRHYFRKLSPRKVGQLIILKPSLDIEAEVGEEYPEPNVAE
jgi:hypothetical protein